MKEATRTYLSKHINYDDGVIYESWFFVWCVVVEENGAMVKKPPAVSSSE